MSTCSASRQASLHKDDLTLIRIALSMKTARTEQRCDDPFPWYRDLAEEQAPRDLLHSEPALTSDEPDGSAAQAGATPRVEAT